MKSSIEICDGEYVDLQEKEDLPEPQTFSAVVNNDDILQMYLKQTWQINSGGN